MAVSAISPNVDNYYIGKGKVYIRMPGDSAGVWWDVGNVPQLEFTPNLTKLDHFSSRAGVKSKDKSITLEKSAQLRIVMEEWTARNLSLALMGTIDDSTPSATTIDIFSLSSIECAIKFVGNNDEGPQWTLEFPRVEFVPTSSINPISDEWGQIEVTGDVLYDDATTSWGTATASFPTAGPTGPTGSV